MKIALYKSIEYGFASICDVTTEEDFNYYENGVKHIRISEFVDIELPMLSKSDYAEKVIAALDEEARQARLELANKLAKIEQRKAEFMALESPL